MQYRRQGILLALVAAYLAFEIVVFDWLTTIPSIAAVVDAAPPLTVSLLQVVAFFAVVWRVSPDELRSALSVPEMRETGVAVAGFVGVLVLAVTSLTVAGLAGVEVAGSTTAVPSMSAPMFAYFTAGIFFTVGMLEEYAFREILQRDVFGIVVDNAAARIAAASVLFAAVHLPFYEAGAGGVAGVGVIFLISIVLGVLYERTGNLVVPVLVHWWWDVFVVGLSAL